MTSETITWGYDKSRYEAKLKLQAINLKLNGTDLDLSADIYLCVCSMLASEDKQYLNSKY